MSQAIFPALPGLAWPLVFSPSWNTKILPSVSGKETRASFQAIPLWTITLPFEFLTSADYKNLAGFFMSCRGQWDSFLLDAGADSIAADTPFATGDGVTKIFQLCRVMGAYAEAVQNVATLANIKAAGSVVSGSGYSVGSTGIVTFTTAPASGAALTWNGSYYYRCRFDQDEAAFEEFMANLYTLKTLKLRGSPGNKLL